MPCFFFSLEHNKRSARQQLQTTALFTLLSRLLKSNSQRHKNNTNTESGNIIVEIEKDIKIHKNRTKFLLLFQLAGLYKQLRYNVLQQRHATYLTMPPKFTIKLKSDIVRAVYSDEDVARDWGLSIRMLKQLLVHSILCNASHDGKTIIHSSNHNNNKRPRSGSKPSAIPSTDTLGANEETHTAAAAATRIPTIYDSLFEWALGALLQDAPSSADAAAGGHLTLSCEVVSQCVKHLVRNGHAERLCREGLMTTLTTFLIGATQWLKHYTRYEPTLAVRCCAALWSSFTLALHYIAAVFAELGQGYILQTVPERTIRGLGGKLFCDTMKGFDGGDLQRVFVLGILELLDSERQGCLMDRSLLKTSLGIATEALLYFPVVEPRLLERTQAFYQNLVKQLLYVECVEGDVFFRTVHTRLLEERERATQCLDYRSKARVEEVCQRSLLEEHGAEVLSNSFAILAEKDDFASLRLSWKLMSLKYVAQGDAARSCFRDYIVRQGTSIVTSSDHSPQAAGGPSSDGSGGVIVALIALYQKAQRIVCQSFENVEAFHLTVREAMQAAIRPRELKIAENLAKYLDSYLREGGRKETDDEVDAAVDASMRLFNFLPAKDVFEAFYAELLAKRLVYQRVRSMELERTVIRKVKDVVGTTSSNKLEGMLKDMTTNEDLSASYQAARSAYLQAEENCCAVAATDVSLSEPSSPVVVTTAEAVFGSPTHAPSGGLAPSPSASLKARPGASIQSVDCKFLVLTLGYWPVFPKLDVALPLSLQHCADHFVSFYVKRHGGRRIEWLPTLSTCTVTARFSKGGRKDITMSLLQGLVMLLFNRISTMTYEEICKQISSVGGKTPVEPGNVDMACSMLGIAGAPVQRLLLRGDGTKTSAVIDKAETFSVNNEFTHRQVKFRINQVQLKDPAVQAQDSNAVKERAFAERAYIVDAAVVRYMKSRRRAGHVDLINDVIAMLKFPASSADVKKRVEVLMEREYLRRDAQDPSVFEYVA